AVPVGGASSAVAATANDVIGTGNAPVGGVIGQVGRVGLAGGLVVVVDAAIGVGRACSARNGGVARAITSTSVGSTELEAAEVAHIRDGVVHAGVGDVVIQRAQ